jgi:cell division septation protein DedD
MRPGGVVRALGRLVLLVALGFGVGLVFGVVLEEPGLLAGHLRGESQSVELTATGADEASLPAAGAGGAAQLPAPGGEAIERVATRPVASASEEARVAQLPRVAAARPVPAPIAEATDPTPTPPRPSASAGAPGATTVAARTASLPASARLAVDAPAAERPWAIQVGAFADAAAADRLAEGLRGRYPVAVLPAEEGGGRFRVRIQPIREEAEARSMAERLKRDDSLPTWVTRMEARSGS